MTYIVEHKIAGKKVTQWFAYRYLETLLPALKELWVVRILDEDRKRVRGVLCAGGIVTMEEEKMRVGLENDW